MHNFLQILDSPAMIIVEPIQPANTKMTVLLTAATVRKATWAMLTIGWATSAAT